MAEGTTDVNSNIDTSICSSSGGTKELEFYPDSENDGVYNEDSYSNYGSDFSDSELDISINFVDTDDVAIIQNSDMATETAKIQVTEINEAPESDIDEFYSDDATTTTTTTTTTR